jgi:hypothetical protein
VTNLSEGEGKGCVYSKDLLEPSFSHFLSWILCKLRFVIPMVEFYISLTVYLGIILVNNQLDALFLCIYLFNISTCFEQPSAHHQANRLYQYIILYISLSEGTSWPAYQAVTYTEWYIPDDVLIQLIRLMMSTGLLETCREVKEIVWKGSSSWLLTRINPR